MGNDNYLEEGDYVYCNNRRIRLIKFIASGGEGSVYETNTPYICKIFKVCNANRYKYEKIELMLRTSISIDGICWPRRMVYNLQGDFIGYLMPKAYGKQLKKIFLNNNSNIEDTSKIDIMFYINLCLTILEKFEYLHRKGIIIGDVSPMNILVVSDEEVYFVDTDSYQIGGFPCLVDLLSYTAPELQVNKNKRYLRTLGNENFSIAILLFVILMHGKYPYSNKSKRELSYNMINGNFNFPIEDRDEEYEGNQILDMWYKLPRYLREAFYKTFKKGEYHNTEDYRLSISDWYKLIKHYQSSLE